MHADMYAYDIYLYSIEISHDYLGRDTERWSVILLIVSTLGTPVDVIAVLFDRVVVWKVLRGFDGMIVSVGRFMRILQEVSQGRCEVPVGFCLGSSSHICLDFTMSCKS